jgi:hypothetical protein
VRTVLERPRDIVRVAIHPPDIDPPVVRESLERALDQLLQVRVPVRYRELFGR